MMFVESKCASNGKNGNVIIEKWRTMLGQVLYTKTFQSIDAQLPFHQSDDPVETRQLSIQDVSATPKQMSRARPDDIATQKRPRQLILTPAAIADLLDHPRFSMNITFRKILSIVACLIEGKRTQAEIAKQFKVQEEVVEQLSNYIISE